MALQAAFGNAANMQFAVGTTEAKMDMALGDYSISLQCIAIAPILTRL